MNHYVYDLLVSTLMLLIKGENQCENETLKRVVRENIC